MESTSSLVIAETISVTAEAFDCWLFGGGFLCEIRYILNKCFVLLQN